MRSRAEAPPHPSWLQRVNQRIASTPPAARLFAYVLHHLDRPVIRVSGGRTSLTSLLTGLPVVTLRTTGAKSGAMRSVPLISMRDGAKIVLVASNWGQKHHPAWYLNLHAHSQVEVSTSGLTRRYLAREASGEEYEGYWRRAAALYVGYAAYKERTGGRKIPIVVLTPTE